MDNRYNKLRSFQNYSDEYSFLRDQKKLETINQYETFNFNKLGEIEKQNLDFITHKVQPFERLYNISQKYYGKPEYGWVILYTNKLSNELLIVPELVLKIYIPLESVLRFA